MPVPPHPQSAGAPPFPATLEIGGFTLYVDTVLRTGTWNAEVNEFRRASDTAWLSFNCEGRRVRPLEPRPGQELPKLKQSLEVVSNAESRQMLLRCGRDAAMRFLDRFDVAGYENTFQVRFTGVAPVDATRAADTTPKAMATA